MSLGWADSIIVCLLGISGLVGLVRGLVREVMSLVSWGLALWVGIRYSAEIENQLQTLIPSPSARMVAAFGILFVASLVVAGLVSFLLLRLIETAGLSGIDRVAGLVFGIARGGLIVSVLVFLAGSTPLPRESWWQESHLIPMFQSMALWLESQMPPGLVTSPEPRLLPH